ncbi:MAG TPA: class I SAM-dependent methyltransferase [Chitinophagaceae bacterium]|nr:class I SAM-dependent methyltransferase [Chitinophagaceae bacterium]
MQTVVHPEGWRNSPYYPLFYSGKYSTEASRFAAELPSLLAMPDESRVLDAACAQGYTAALLAADELEVTAIDNSETDIAIALQHRRSNLQFAIHDLRLPFLSNYFDFAVSLFGRFGHYRTLREYAAAIRTLAIALKPDGILLIDYFNTPWKQQHLKPLQVVPRSNITFTIQQREDALFFYRQTDVSDPALNAPVSFRSQQAKLSLADFTRFFHLHGLEVQRIYGDYDASAYREAGSPRLIMIAQKLTQEAGDKKKRLYSDGRTTDALT